VHALQAGLSNDVIAALVAMMCRAPARASVAPLATSPALFLLRRRTSSDFILSLARTPCPRSFAGPVLSACWGWFPDYSFQNWTERLTCRPLSAAVVTLEIRGTITCALELHSRLCPPVFARCSCVHNFKCTSRAASHTKLPLRHVQATVRVPSDALIADFVFLDSDNISSGFYDNNRGLDYHVPVTGAAGRLPPINVAHVAVEMAPIAKVGGMGDVVTALGRAVQEVGHNVEVCPSTALVPFQPCLPTCRRGHVYCRHPGPVF
jgi:hypothetical protein